MEGQITINGDPYFAAEKFSQAVYMLAVGAGPVKERLHAAFIEFCPVGERDVPPSLLDEYRWIRSELTKAEPRLRALVEGAVVVGVEGRLGATLRTMRTARAVAIAERICAFADKLEALVAGQ